MSKICIIGAGSSGITTIKALRERGLPFDCFEMASDIGGNWRYGNDNGRSAAYKSLHIDTSKQRMAYSDFPMPDHYPDFPHHSQVNEYFHLYVDHFDLRRHITFNTKVVKVECRIGGGYIVTTQGDGGVVSAEYRSVIVCNGHHWNPKWPDFAGEFDGQVSHSRTYRSAEGLEDKNVLVVGIGNSGTDIACEVSRVAKNTYLSTRRSAYIIPRYILGKPTDQWNTEAASYLPWPLQRAAYKVLLNISQGNQENVGVKAPDHKLLSEHPTMSADLLTYVGLGKIKMKPDVRELQGDIVVFEDGSVAPIDAIVYATGYKITFPFLQDTIFDVVDNDIQLYRKVVMPDKPNLFFIGLIQPLGAIMPLAEVQAKWVAHLLAGTATLPDHETMRKEIAKTTAAMRKRYVKSTRHTIQVDFFPYKRSVEKEIKEGLARSQAQLALTSGNG